MISTIQHNLKAAARFGFFLKNIIAGLLLLAVQQVQAQTATLPLQKGMAVVSCFSGIGNNNAGQVQSPNGTVLAIFDIRDPQGNGAPSNPSAQWAAASAGAYHPANWNATNMGEIFGVSIEEGATAPAIFATTTGITSIALMSLSPKFGGTGGEVFRINGTTGAITTLATLPNTIYSYSGQRYVGLGDNTYNRIKNVLYVSNIDNGLVYAVDATTGALLGTPFNHNTTTADNPAQPFTQVERIVFGLGYNVQENKLYYSVKAGNALSTNSEVYTVGLNADGSINAASKSASAVVSFSPLQRSMISDIAFSADGTQMLLAEMTLNYGSYGSINILTKDAHTARVFKYVNSAGTWSQNLNYYGQIGTYTLGANSGANAAGGVDFGFNNYGTNSAGTNLDDAAVMTADCIYCDDMASFVNAYGLQITNIVAPNTFASSYAVDLDGKIGTGELADKFTSGDVEVFGDIACTSPTLTLTQTAPGCSPGAIPNNNGKITLTAFSNADRYGVSTGATYTGPVYASATALPAVPPSLDVQINIPNTGGTYTIRLFNQNNACFTDQTVVVAPVTCSCPATTYPVCAGESYTLTAAPGLTNIQWQINTGAGSVDIPGANGSTFVATLVGTYTYTATDPGAGLYRAACCPVTLVAAVAPSYQ